MSTTDHVRVALALPMRSAPEMAAATRIVVSLLQSTRGVELRLISRGPSALVRRLPAALLVASDVTLSPGDNAARARLERTVRIQIERQYARQGVLDVDYDLEIL
jgi:hypothetical protein